MARSLLPTGWTRARALVGVALICAGLASCSSAPVAPDVRAVRAAQRAATAATRQSIDGTQSSGPFVLPMRFNPPSSESCLCPPFEVRYEGSWHRVVVQTSVEIQQRLDTLVATGRELPAGVYAFVGVPNNDTTRLSDDGQLFATFELLELRSLPAPAAAP